MIGAFYHLMHLSYEKVFGRQHMLHYPLYQKGDQSLLQGQMNFTDHCLSRLPDLRDKRLLDIGCGNGVQTLYIHEKYDPQYVYGIDINDMHVRLAKTAVEQRNLKRIGFAVDNSQVLSSVDDNSFDLVLCTESAHHYPDKRAFLSQIKRVLRPGGQFLIADLLRRKNKAPGTLEKKMYLYHWPHQSYRETFADLQFNVMREEDLTDLILPAFQNTAHWFDTPGQKHGAAYHLGKMFGKGLISLYIYELTNSYQYYLLVGKKT